MLRCVFACLKRPQSQRLIGRRLRQKQSIPAGEEDPSPQKPEVQNLNLLPVKLGISDNLFTEVPERSFRRRCSGDGLKKSSAGKSR
jgi:hypothetical protein